MAADTLSTEQLSQQLSQLGVGSSVPKLEGAFPTVNPTDIHRSFLAQTVADITGVDNQLIYSCLDWTNTLDKGDLLLACPRLRVKGTKPADLATKIVENFPESSLFQRPESDGIFVRFVFAPKSLPSLILPYVYDLKSTYGSNRLQGLKDPQDPSKGNKKIVIEFSSPNIAKEFHAGHLRSTIIGGFLSNLYEAGGWDVVRMNYLGDWGRQYGLLAIAWEKFGSEEAFQRNPTGHLFDIYVKISALFKPEDDAFKAASKRGDDTVELENSGLLGQAKRYFRSMEEGDEQALELWRRFRVLSIEKYKQTYARLNIHFDDYSGESQVSQETMNKAEEILREKGISEVDQGATIINFKNHGFPKLETAVVRNRNNTTTYILRDVGAAIERYDKYGFDSILYVVMSEQDIHIKRLIAILQLAGYTEISSRMTHVNFGKVQGMSTRKGTVKFLDDILEEVGTSMHDVMRRNKAKYDVVENPEDVADTLGISAVMVQDMSGKRINNYPFDIVRMTSFEGDTGPYLQYAHARLKSIARKTTFTAEDLAKADFSLLQEPHAVDLVRLIGRYPDTIAQTLKTLEPTTVLTYLFKLTHQLSSSYDVLRVVNAPEGPEVSKARAALYEAACQTINNGMRMLGLTPVDR
ncbi:MAG: hypothetical protein M4579_006347 [Chaenotheca gracillima]|nr:MAG: hypothetical protein M4579_006347 [Chaenotheca gracillima]